jgi:hypothetical protein
MTNAQQFIVFFRPDKASVVVADAAKNSTGCLIQILIGKRIACCGFGNQPIGNCGRTAEYLGVLAHGGF